MTYKGITSPIEVVYERLDADSHQYFDIENLIPGSVVSGTAKDNGIGHMWFYMGQFDSRDSVLDYLVKLGYDRNAVSPYVGSGNGDGGKHWRIECNGSQGCVINNNTDGKARFKSFVAYKLTSRDATFSIKNASMVRVRLSENHLLTAVLQSTAFIPILSAKQRSEKLQSELTVSVRSSFPTAHIMLRNFPLRKATLSRLKFTS